MKCDIVNLDNQNVGSIELSDSVFGVDVRSDILSRVVNWQLANRRAGTHKTKTIAEVSGTTKKPYKQKGTGRARQGSLRATQFRGALKLPEIKTKELVAKMEKMGLKSALFVGGAELDANFKLAARNIVGIDVLPQQGANVYDILRRDTLVLTKEAAENLEARLK